MSIKTPEELRDDGRVIKLCVPSGIGDISWIYSKIKHLRAMTHNSMEVLVYVAGDEPKRAGDFVELCPEVHFGGYLEDRGSFNVIAQSIPAEWPSTVGGIGFLHKPEILNISANIHLELGRSLRDWLPLLPVDYHYPLNISPEHQDEAAQLLSEAVRPIVAIYVSNRDKEKQLAGGWNLWSTEQWVHFVKALAAFPELKDATFVFLGAEYDRDKTSDVVNELDRAGHRTIQVIGRPLGLALECLKRSHYFVAYPSGIGILANVLNVPGLMLLPWILKGLETSYADPIDLGYQRYRAWCNPSPVEALSWIKRIGIPQSFYWL